MTDEQAERVIRLLRSIRALLAATTLCVTIFVGWHLGKETIPFVRQLVTGR